MCLGVGLMGAMVGMEETSCWFAIRRSAIWGR
jgi:hypothetical protein